MPDDRENHPDDEQKPETDPKPYEVGRGRPPKDRQWTPGQSGNRSGKRKPSYGDMCNRILLERVPGEENGRPISLTRVKGVVHRGAILGDPVDEDILLSFEKPGDSAPTKYWDFRLVDSE